MAFKNLSKKTTTTTAKVQEKPQQIKKNAAKPKPAPVAVVEPEEEEEVETQTVDADEVGEVEEVLGEETESTDTTAEEDPFAVFGGDELKVEPRRRDAHTGKITAVQYFESDKGSKAIQVLLKSDQTGNDDKFTIWIPAVWAEDVGAFLRKEKTLEDLPPGEPDPERPGKIKGNQRMQYGMAIKNSAGDASVQQLLSIAAKSGRRPTEGVALETLDDYITELNTICADLDVVYTRKPQVSDDNPRGFLNVNALYFPGDVVGNPKALRNYVKHWEEQTL